MWLTSSSEKMLRDRLRLWGANTKSRSALTALSRAQSPDSTPNWTATESRHANILIQLDRLFERGWEHISDKKVAGRSDLVGLVSDFNSMAMVAVDTGRPQAWAAVNRTAASIAKADWSTLGPSQVTAILLSPPSISWSREELPMNTEERQVHMILKSVLSMQLGQNHPLMLFMDENLEGRLCPGLCYYVTALEELKVRQHAPPARQHRMAAESRRRLSSILFYFRDYKTIDDVLEPYDAVGMGKVPIWLQGYIQTLLGRSKYAQSRYTEASRHFQQAEDMDDGADLISTVYVSKYGALSLLAQEDVNGAEALLLRLLRTLRDSISTGRHVDSECLAFDVRCLCS